MAINFPDSPVDGQEVTLANTSWMYSTSKSAWLRTSKGVTVDGLKVYNTISDLPLSGLTAGQQAFISSSNTYYVSNGSGWYSVTLVNTSPSITAVQDASANTTPFTLNTDGSTTVITVTATDPEDTPLIYSYSVTSGSLNGTTITQSSNVFTITPHASNATTFELTFTASDGVNTATSGVNSFTLQFVANWTNGTEISQIDSFVGLSDHTTAGRRFGFQVAMSSDNSTIAVGMLYSVGYNGRVYIFTRSGSTFTQQTILIPSDDATRVGQHFGSSLALSSDGNTLAVGAPNASYSSNTNVGHMYVFTRSGSTWTEEAIIDPSGTKNNNSDFGWMDIDISEDGNTICAGAWREDLQSGTGRGGAAYVFTRSGSTWTEEQRIPNPNGGAGYYFGLSTAISDDGNTLVAADYIEGAFYVFTRSGSTWTQQARVTPTNNSTGGRFGWCVDISGDGSTIAIAERDNGTAASTAGRVYIFTGSGATWTEQADFVPSDVAANDQFGNRVSLSYDGNILAAQSRYEDDVYTDTGAVYIFQRTGTTWTEKKKLTPSNSGASTRITSILKGWYGDATEISADGYTLLVGFADEDTNNLARRGNIYVYTTT